MGKEGGLQIEEAVEGLLGLIEMRYSIKFTVS